MVITKDDLPGVLLGLDLQDIYGIGKRMEQRLHRASIVNVEQLWNATPHRLRRVWGGVNGLLFHQMLHGVDIQPPTSRYSKSIGHQHVLVPDLRTKKGAHDFAQHLLTKAAERLRRASTCPGSAISAAGGMKPIFMRRAIPDSCSPASSGLLGAGNCRDYGPLGVPYSFHS